MQKLYKAKYVVDVVFACNPAQENLKEQAKYFLKKEENNRAHIYDNLMYETIQEVSLISELSEALQKKYVWGADKSMRPAEFFEFQKSEKQKEKEQQYAQYLALKKIFEKESCEDCCENVL